MGIILELIRPIGARSLGWRLVFSAPLVALALVAGSASGSASDRPAAMTEMRLASLLPNGANLVKRRPMAAPTALPQVLSDADVRLYHKIYALQEAGKWRTADKAIKRLDDTVLLGHLKAQRYLHPTKYRSRYKELKAWMADYADLPQANQLYKLAMKRRPKNWRVPRRPQYGSAYGSGYAASTVKTRSGTSHLSRAKRSQVRQLESKLRRYMRKGATLAIKRELRDKKVKRLLPALVYDRAQAYLGAGYYGDGRDQWALEWSSRAAKRSGRYLPEAHWTAARAAWRLGRFEVAASHFEAVAESRYASSWLRSAGAFWAARAGVRFNKPAYANKWFGKASAYPRTFYGLLARRVLGLEVAFDWSVPLDHDDGLDRLTAIDGGRRALALLQLGKKSMAERELRGLFGKTDPQTTKTLLALATRGNLPGLAMRLGNAVAARGDGRLDAATYPIGDWQPAGGYEVDRALVFAIIRQESGFNPSAKSYAGARGLMQLMPATAGFIARDRRFRGSKRNALFNPQTNLTLGQKYIRHLLNDRGIKKDLFLTLAAWNGGPGNLRKWQRRVKYNNDPLLFIESLPSRETRIFVERVMTNLWIYRDRLGQPAPSLDAVAQGDWPTYIGQDNNPVLVAGR